MKLKSKSQSQRKNKYSFKDSSFEEDDYDTKKNKNNQKIKNLKDKYSFKKILTQKSLFNLKLLIPIALLWFSILFYFFYNIYKKKKIKNNINPIEELRQANLHEKYQSNIYDENEFNPYNNSN